MKKHTYLAICIITSLLLVGVLLNILNPAQPALAAVSNNLVGYWTLDEGSGTTALDSSANGNDGTLTNGPTYTSNVPGTITFSDPYALTFDGVDDYVSLPDAAVYDFALNEDFTVAVWVQVDATQADTGNRDNSIVEKWSGTGGYPFVIRYMNQTSGNAGQVRVARYDGSNNPSVLSSVVINDGQYHHLVFVKDGTTLYLYIDGALDGQIPDTTMGTTTNSSPLYLGQRGNGINRFKGELDDLRIYNRALSAAEVASLAGGADGFACATEYTGDNVTDFISSDGSAVTNAIAAASPGDTIKIAGTCAGTSVTAGESQTVYISRSLTLEGGYPLTTTAWLNTPDPQTNVTTLDAQNSGRVVNVDGVVDVTISGLTIVDGSNGNGGGLRIQNGAVVTLTEVLVFSNEGGAGATYVDNSTLHVIDSTFDGNSGGSSQGGAIRAYGSSAILTVAGSTFTNNSTYSGGGAIGVINNAMVDIVNSTFSNNRSRNHGGAIFNNSGFLTLSYSTIVSNTADTNNDSTGDAGGLYSTASTVVTATLIISNTDLSPSGQDDCLINWRTNSGGYNLVGLNTGCTFATQSTDQTIADASLAPLADNGGKTETVALQSDSPAVDGVPAGAAGCEASLGIDQRGETRADWACDIGAFEMQFSDSDTVSKTIAGADTYTFGPTLAKVAVDDDGGCLTGLSIQRENSDHPQATDPNLQTGVNWTLSPAGCSSGFTVTLTLPTPNFTPDANGKLCRWDSAGSSWDCGLSSNHSFGIATMSDGSTINAVTRSNINEFSQWTAGNKVYACQVEASGDDKTDFGSDDYTALQQAIDAANDGDALKIAGTCAGTGVTAGESQTAYISQSLTLEGGYPLTTTAWLSVADPQTNVTTLDAQNSGRVVNVDGAVDVTISGLTMVDGSNGNGGGLRIQNSAVVTLTEVLVSSNSGGVGATYVDNSSLHVIDSTFDSNSGGSSQGGAIRAYGSSALLTVAGSTFTNNSIYGGGGAIGVINGATAEIINSTFSENRARNHGGAIFNNGGFLALSYSTLVSNTADTDGNGNGSGGGLYVQSILSPASALITATLMISNTDLSPSGHDDCFINASTNSGGYNLVGLNSGCTFASQSTDQSVADASLAPLADNGGKTETVALQSDSPAVDGVPAGAAGCEAGLGIDQRGQTRHDWACDIGAFEMQFGDSDTVSQTIAGAGTYTFGPTLAKAVVDDDGGCLTGLSIQRENSNHPQATEANLQTGVNWTLSPVGCSSGFTVTLTLPTPNFTPDVDSKLCRWDATSSSWDCGQSSEHSFGAATMSDGSTLNAVTRSNVNEFSQWTAGNQVGPTAVRLLNFSTTAKSSWVNMLFALVSLIVLGGAVVWHATRPPCKHK